MERSEPSPKEGGASGPEDVEGEGPEEGGPSEPQAKEAVEGEEAMPAASPLEMTRATLREGAAASGVLVPEGIALLPVMEPSFNLREIAKQMLLLESHLAVPRQRCADCIRKHYATIEALAEEGASLDAERGALEGVFADAAEFARHWQARLYAEGIADPARSGDLDPATMRAAAAALRKARKPMLKLSGNDFFDGKRYVLQHRLALALGGGAGRE